MEINGVAHIMLAVGDFARARAFYGRLLPALGLTALVDSAELYYCVGGRTALGIVSAGAEHAGERFSQSRVGLHHVCLRARSRDAVDAAHRLLQDMGACVVRTPEAGPWAPGYYSVLFEDPDGIRLEINFVPGKGLLDTVAHGERSGPGIDRP